MDAEDPVDHDLRDGFRFLIARWPDLHPLGKVVDQRHDILVSAGGCGMRSDQIDANALSGLAGEHWLKEAMSTHLSPSESSALFTVFDGATHILGLSRPIVALLDFGQ